jgi:integrase/recombinase XerD
MKIKELIPDYLKYMKALGRSYYTIKVAKYEIQALADFMGKEKLYNVEDMTGDMLQSYQKELAFRLTAKGRLLGLGTQSKMLSMIRGFTRYLKQKDFLVHDPGESIQLPKKAKRLPKSILNQSEIKKLMEAPDMQTNRGYRNRIILEILYDTGIRRSELADIKLIDLDLSAGYIRICGKGKKERVVPLSERVCGIVQNYILAVRCSFLNGKDPGYLILNRWGQKMDPNGVWAVVKRCTHLAHLKKNATTHTLRHSCATHMLKNGAPVRHIQEMLGHESLESTQIYTHVTINDLKAIHAKYHPSETLQSRPK